MEKNDSFTLNLKRKVFGVDLFVEIMLMSFVFDYMRLRFVSFF